MNAVGHHFVILGFKVGKRNSKLTFATDGVASDFMRKFARVNLLWEAHCKAALEQEGANPERWVLLLVAEITQTRIQMIYHYKPSWQ